MEAATIKRLYYIHSYYYLYYTIIVIICQEGALMASYGDISDFVTHKLQYFMDNK